MKRIYIIILLIGIQIGLFGHANTVHNSLINDVLDYLESTYGTGNTYYQVISTYPNFFKYGSTLPDMQYVNASKPTLESIYSDVNDAFSCSITYEIIMDEVPDPDGVNASYSFGINTHNKEYAFAFAQYLLDQANLMDPPGNDPGPNGNNSVTGLTSQSRAMKLALACGYYAHLVEDIVGHNYWVPKLTAESGIHELNLLNNDAAGLSETPGIQSHYFIETCHDYSMGESASIDFKNTIYDMYVISGQVEPSYAWMLVNNYDWAGLNPALDFFHDVLADWYNNNPENLPSDYRYGNLISSTGFIQECHMWRFMNQFYPETLGYGSLPNALANWISDHTYSLLFEDILGMVFFGIVDWFFDDYVFNTALDSVEPKMGSALQTLLGISRNDPSLANQIVADNPDKINSSEYTRMLSNPIYTNPNYFSSFDYYAGLEAKYFDEIGPSGYLYNEWAPDNHSAYSWGVLSTLNNLTTEYQMRTDIGVYDFYFLVDGQKYDDLSSFTGINHNFTAVAELFALEPITQPLNILGELKLDRHGDNSTLDILLKDQTITFSQDPSNYNTVERVKLNISFNSSDFTNIPLIDYQGIYLDLSIVNEQPFFSTNWEIYEDITDVVNNTRFDHYDTYTSYPYSYNLAFSGLVSGEVSLIGGQGDIEDVLITFDPISGPNIEVSPNSNGDYSCVFSNSEFGTYDITYELFSADADYYPITIEDVVIDGTTAPLTLDTVELQPISDPTNVNVSNDENIPAFPTIQKAVDYLIEMEIDGTIKIFPGTYNECVDWNSDTAHIKVSGLNQETCFIEGFITVYGTNSNENDVIENLTFRNTSYAIQNIGNGLNTVRNNKFENCNDDFIVINNGGGGVENGTFRLINNKFVNNDCLSCYYSLLYSQHPASVNNEIIDNVFENNTVKYPLLWIEGHGQLTINENTFKNNTYQTNGSIEYGSIIDILRSSAEEITSCFIEENVFQNNRDMNARTNGVISIRNDPAFGNYKIDNNSFVGNNALSMIHYDANQPSSSISNSIFESNTVYGNEVINGINLHCYYSLFYDNNSDNGNCIFLENIYSEVNPLLDENNKPLWNSTSKSPCIDTGYGSNDPDGTPADIGAIRAIDHKIETIELIDANRGINWKCFPVLDDIYAEEDIAANVLYDIMLEPYPAALALVETQGGENNIYYNTYWHNAEQEFTSVKGYKLKMNEAATLEITGFLEYSEQTINLVAGGENWLGYFLEESMNPFDALAAVLDKINRITTRTFTYIKLADNSWLGVGSVPIEPTFNYGDLVIVSCTENGSFFWGQNGGGTNPKEIRSSSQDFTYTEEADYIPVFVELDLEALGNPTEIGIFVENECKGAEVIEDTLVQMRAYVFNDTVTFDPGTVEFQLSYGSRSENVLIDSYTLKETLDDTGKMGILDFSETQNSYYLISLSEPENNVPEVTKTSLDQNYPNPFNPSTTIAYSILNDGMIELKVYNIKGQLVKTLVMGEQQTGSYEVVWNGKDNNEKNISSGVYFYKLTTKDDTIMKKMLMLK